MIIAHRWSLAVSTRWLGALALSLVAAALIAHSATAQEAQSQPASMPATEPALPDLKPIQKQVEELRGLKFKKDVPAEKQSLEDFDKFVTDELDSTFPVAKRDHMMAALVRLGLLLKPIDLQDEFKNALLSQAGAYYDPGTGKFFYLMADLPKMMLDVTAAHELVHALQDQHYDLGKKMKAWESMTSGDVRNDDAVLAVRYLVEGEATYIMTLWQAKSMLGTDLSTAPEQESMMIKAMSNIKVGQLIAMSKMQQLPMLMGKKNESMTKAIAAMDKIPSYIMYPLLAAYMGGANFVMEVRHKGGWDAVAALWDKPPVSSEQCMHPDKYLAEVDQPTPIDMPASRTLGANWKPIDSAINGEYLLRLLLQNFGCTSAVAAKAAAGWDGDIYRAYQHADGRVLVALATTWDTEQDAKEFADAYRAMVPRKYPDFAPLSKEVNPVTLTYNCAGEFDRGEIYLRGTEVFIVEGGSGDECDRVMDELMALPIHHVN